MKRYEPQLDPAEAVRTAARKAQANKIVFVSGNFNVVHPGHLRLLKFAHDCGDFLAVGLNDDSSRDVTVPEQMRLDSMRAISLVNSAFILREPPESFIRRLKPAIVVKGKEYEERHNPEQQAVEEYGGRLLFGSGEVRFSSLDLLRREYRETNFSTIKKPQEFAARHGFSVHDLKRVLPKMNGMKVVVTGDLIIDEYIDCDPLGMSQEDPTIVVTPINRERFVGGAAIVAAHARSLGADVRYFSVAGTDEAAVFGTDLLKRYKVDAVLISDESRPTTLKQRYRAAGKTLLRVSHLRQHAISPEIAHALCSALDPDVRTCDLLIFADFNYGCLPQSLVDRVSALGREHGRRMVADSQASSQLSDISRFKGMLLVTPTEREARLALRDFDSGLVILAEKLRRAASAENVVVTLGNEGVLVHGRSNGEYITDRLPAFNTAPKDTAGAGDSFITCSAMAMCCGLDTWRSAYLGSLAAACQVGRVGNIPITQQDLITEIEQP